MFTLTRTRFFKPNPNLSVRLRQSPLWAIFFICINPTITVTVCLSYFTLSQFYLQPLLAWCLFLTFRFLLQLSNTLHTRLFCNLVRYILRAGLRGGGYGGYGPGAPRSVIKSLSMASSKNKKDPFGFKFNQIKYEKFRWPLRHFCMLWWFFEILAIDISKWQPCKSFNTAFRRSIWRRVFFTLFLLYILYIFSQFFRPLLSGVAGVRGPPFFLKKIFFRKDLFPWWFA